MPEAIRSPAEPSPPPDPDGRMSMHLKVLALLNIAGGALAAGGFLLFVYILGMGQGSFVTAFREIFLEAPFRAFYVISGAASLLSITAGILLLFRRRLGKGFGFVAAALQLVGFPFGTALGAYGFYVLTRPQTNRLLEAR